MCLSDLPWWHRCFGTRGRAGQQCFEVDFPECSSSDSVIVRLIADQYLGQDHGHLPLSEAVSLIQWAYSSA